MSSSPMLRSEISRRDRLSTVFWRIEAIQGQCAFHHDHVRACLPVKSGSASTRAIRESYGLQVPQLVAEHVPQEEPSPTRVDAPSPLLEKEAKEENIRLALL